MRLARALVVTLALAVAGSSPLSAQSLDSASSAALDATLRLLLDPAQRSAAIARSPQAAAVDRELASMLSTPELQQEFYALVAEVFADVVQGSGGDVGRLSQTLEAGRRDPTGFVGRLSPQTLDRLRAFAGKVEKNR
jgi:hypothetical protein